MFRIPHKIATVTTLGLIGLLAIGGQAQNERRPGWILPPQPIPPRPQLEQELRLLNQSARVEINGGLAKTHLEQTFENTTGRTIEGTYTFPLPSGAAVSGFAMTVNGKRVEAEILEGDKAREIYTGIVQKMRDPAILEFIDRNLIRARIFPIAAGDKPKVELEYAESLKPENSSKDGGSFRYVLPMRLPVGGTARQASLDIRLRSPQGLRAIYSPTHEIDVRRDGDSARLSGEFTNLSPLQSTSDGGTKGKSGSDRDFVLYFTSARERVGVNAITHRPPGEDGYFMMLVAPDPVVAAREIAAKDVVFVFDTSGSMSGEKIEQARRALLNLLGNLNPNDRFNIVTFSSETRSFRDNIVAVDKSTLEAARAWVQEIKAVGGTNINDALVESLKQLKGGERPQQIVFMTDGQPTVGETDVAQILKNVRTANPEAGGEQARLFVFGVGYDVNTRLLDTLAEDNRGSSDYVLPNEDIEQKVGALYAKIAFPVLSNPRLDWGGLKVYDVYPKRLPDLFRGTQSVVFGRYDGGNLNAARVQLIGTAQGRESRISGDGDWKSEGKSNDTLPRLWAMRKVGYLMDDARLSGRAVPQEVRDEIIKLSRKYGIVTPFTAGLITEDTPASGVPASGVAGQVPAPPRLTITPSILHRSGTSSYIQGGAPGVGAATPSGSRDMVVAGGGLAAGEAAVRGARASKELKESGRVDESANTRYIEGKAFFLQDNVWTDGAYDAAKMKQIETIKFGSNQYFALLKDAKVARWLSIGERILLVLPDKVVRIEP
jgi:Ca-activated chloride channel family protein